MRKLKFKKSNSKPQQQDGTKFRRHIEIAYDRAKERFERPPTSDEVASMYTKLFPGEWDNRMRRTAINELKAQILKILTKGKTMSEWAPVLETQLEMFETVPDGTQLKYGIPTNDGVVIKLFTECCINDLLARKEMLTKQIQADSAAMLKEVDAPIRWARGLGIPDDIAFGDYAKTWTASIQRRR